MKKQKIIFFSLGIIAGLILGAAGMTIYKNHATKSSPTQKSEQITIEGKLICLPHKNTDGPQTLECASGLQSADGKNYALSSSTDINALTQATGSEKKARVTGVLGKNANDTYKSEGTITVASYEFIQ